MKLLFRAIYGWEQELFHKSIHPCYLLSRLIHPLA